MTLEQDSRSLQLKTPLGENELLLTAFRGRERMSEPFEFELEMISDNAAIAAKDIIGKDVTFSVVVDGSKRREFNGIVTEFRAGDERDGRRNYKAIVRPWLWLLSQKKDCRIFQEKTAPEIIEQIFQDLGCTDFELQLKADHPTRTYCVQYRQSSLDFVSRLAEEEGIFYFFEHSEGQHKLIMADQASAYKDADCDSLDLPTDFGSYALRDHLKSWEHRYRFCSGKLAQQDFNFETPSTSLMTNTKSLVDLPGIDKYEVYDYPGTYPTAAEGDPMSKVLLEAVEAEHDVVEGTSNCKQFSPGYKFSVGEHRSACENGQTFAVLSVSHEAQEPMAYESGGTVELDYRNEFSCIPDSVTFRAPRKSPTPQVQGPQTAIVVGPPGEEIYPDEHGRVKVQFHWDREGSKDEESSCWIRVSQAYGGKGWGMMCIPRIGQEVIVEFLEGDPDQPIITGRVYNAESMPPFKLPDSKAISGFKSNSTPGGGGYNELTFDDSKGSELIKVHGQFDMDTTIENDLREHVLNNRSRDVSNNEEISIGANQTVAVQGNQDISVAKNQETKISQNQSLDVKGNQTSNIDSNRETTVTGNQTSNVNGDHQTTVGAMMALTVGASRTTSVGANESLSVGGQQKIEANGPIEIKSNAMITLSVGGSTIKLHPGGIDITSAGLVQIQGSVVKIN